MPKSVSNDVYEAFKQALVDARKRAGLTQVELAERLGKPQSFISKIELGERKVDVLEFAAVAKAMSLDPAKFLDSILKHLPKVWDI